MGCHFAVRSRFHPNPTEKKRKDKPQFMASGSRVKVGKFVMHLASIKLRFLVFPFRLSAGTHTHTRGFADPNEINETTLKSGL